MKKKSFLLSFQILFALLALVGCKKHPSGETLSKVSPDQSTCSKQCSSKITGHHHRHIRTYGGDIFGRRGRVTKEI